jgi:SAM-dependent methyltransferase
MNDAADIIIAPYERHARAWDADRRSLGWNDRYWIDRFLDLLPTGGHVLDLGCGGGSPMAARTVARGFHVTGADSSPTLISLCRSRLPEQEWVVTTCGRCRSAGVSMACRRGTASFI